MILPIPVKNWQILFFLVLFPPSQGPYPLCLQFEKCVSLERKQVPPVWIATLSFFFRKPQNPVIPLLFGCPKSPHPDFYMTPPPPHVPPLSDSQPQSSRFKGLHFYDVCVFKAQEFPPFFSSDLEIRASLRMDFAAVYHSFCKIRVDFLFSILSPPEGERFFFPLGTKPPPREASVPPLSMKSEDGHTSLLV